MKAASDIELNVDDQQLVDAFKKLGKAIDNAPELRAAEKAAGKYLISKGKTNLSSRNRKRTGRLVKGFRIKTMKKNGGVMAGFAYNNGRNGMKKGQGANHAHLVDRGTKERNTMRGYTDKLGRHYKKGISRGKMPGSSFWSDVNKNDTGRAMEMLMEGIRKAINNT